MPIRRRALAQQRGRLDEVLAALGAAAGADVVHFVAALVTALDRHAARQREVGFDVGHAAHVAQRALCKVAVALVAGLLAGRVAARLGHRHAVGAFALQAARTLHRVRVVAAQARGAPHRQVGREIALGTGGGVEGFVGHLRIGVRRQGPGLARLVVACNADDVGRLGEAAAGGRLLLEAVDAQELRRTLERVGLAQVRVVAGGALHLSAFEWQLRLDAGRARADRAAVGDAQFAVARRQRCVVGEGDRVVVCQVGADVACEAGGRAGAGGHRAAGAGAGERDALVGPAVEHVDAAQRQRAVVARQAQLGTATRPGRQLGGVGFDRTRGVGRVGGTRELAVPQRRGGNVFRAMRGVAEDADLRFAGRLDGAGAGRRQVVLGVGDVGDFRRRHRPHLRQGQQHGQRQQDQQRCGACHHRPPRN